MISLEKSPATGVQDSNNKILLRDFGQPQELLGERNRNEGPGRSSDRSENNLHLP